jgi:hypothetical protein
VNRETATSVVWIAVGLVMALAAAWVVVHGTAPEYARVLALVGVAIGVDIASQELSELAAARGER